MKDNWDELAAVRLDRIADALEIIADHVKNLDLRLESEEEQTLPDQVIEK